MFRQTMRLLKLFRGIQQSFPKVRLKLFQKKMGTLPMLADCISDVSGGVRIKLHVHPGAKRNGISGFFGDSVKFDLQTPPVDGKANAALQKVLSKLLKCSKSSIILISGETSRDKVLEIRNMDKTALINILNDHIL